MSSSKELSKFRLPIKKDTVQQLDLRSSLIHEDDKRGLLNLLSTRIPEKLEKIIVKPLVLKTKAYLPDYKFRSDYLNDDNFHILVDELKDFLYKDFARDKEKNNSDSYLQLKMQEVALKSKALLSVIDDLHFTPRSSKEAISADLRKLFIRAHKYARDELIYAKKLLTQDDPHLALSRFEIFTGRTPHYNLEEPDFDKRLQAFMPVRTEELDWRHKSLNVLKELFKLDETEAQSIVKYLSMFSDANLRLEGFVRTAMRQPYINLSGEVLDKSICPELNDPDLEDMPLSTVVHEITHVLLKDRYSDILKFNSDSKTDSSNLNKKFQLPFDQRVSLPIAYIEELICFALTIYINPLTTVAKLASVKPDSDVQENYAAAAKYGKYLYEKYRLADLSARDAALKSIKIESLDLARACINLLDNFDKNK